MSDRVRAYDVQTQALDLFQGKVMAILEEELDNWADEGQVIQIDKLELDLGRLWLEDIATELPRLIRQKFQETFPKVMAAEYGQEAVSKMSVRPVEEVDLDTLLRFLETGRMGWRVDREGNSPVEILQNLLATRPEMVMKALSARMGEPGFRARLCLQTPAAVRDRLLMLMALSDFSEWQAVILATFNRAMQWTEAIRWPAWSSELALAMVHDRVFAILADSGQVPSETLLLNQVIQEGAVTGKISVRQLETRLHNATLEQLLEIGGLIGTVLADIAGNVEAYLRSHTLTQGELVMVRNLLQKWIIEHATGKSAVPPLSGMQDDLLMAVALQPISVQETVATAILGSRHGLAESLGRIVPQSSNAGDSARHSERIHSKSSAGGHRSESLRPEEEEIYVTNAGLVLLNPFFQPCFEELGWMEGGEFLDEESRENAVLLTAYMACGLLEISEEKLPLAKLLCGMELDVPVRMSVDLPARALEEADALLLAANGYWEKAGKLSPDQFREAFLIREGRLTPQSAGWEIKVDRHTIDILLEFIPWSYGTIKLPWMPGMLTVDW